MTRRMTGLTSTIVLALGIAAFTGSALAGNGDGNGNGNGNAAAPAAPAASEPASHGSPPASPGNSANAPGQAKKDTASSKSQGGGSAIQTSTAGVKPSNSTEKDTHELATSNKTKLYGNGQTAGQIAVQAGYTGMLHGPGNSQPHKAALCPGHPEVDVHALKAPGLQRKCAAAAPTAVTKAKVTPTHVAPSKAASVSVAGGVKGPVAAPTHAAAPQGGVLGVTTSGKSQPVGGVLGAIEAVGGGVLPFTGFPLWAALLVGMGLVAFGLALRRHARATA